MTRATINGSTLRWAREAMRVEIDELARAADTNADRITEFESGDVSPTMRQLEKMAKKLDRTLAFFFIEAPAELDVPATADFRAGGNSAIPSLLAREMRRAELHREAVLDLESDVRPVTITDAITRRNVESRATEMRSLLGLTVEFRPPEKENQALNFWRGLFENHGYLIFQTTKVDLAAFRGLSVHHSQLPIILLNGADSNNAKVFTLLHEVAHLINRTSGMCDLDDGTSEEAIANSFAANFLMPRSQVENLVFHTATNAFDLAETVAAEFKVSLLAAAVRLHTLGRISEFELAAIRTESNRQWERVREHRKEKGGGPQQWRLRYRDLGPGYIGTIARALEDNRVNLLDASYLLNARIPMVKKMLDEYYRYEAFE